MEIKNFSWNANTNKNNHSLLPKGIRMVMIGKSGCGKVTLWEIYCYKKLVGFCTVACFWKKIVSTRV